MKRIWVRTESVTGDGPVSQAELSNSITFPYGINYMVTIPYTYCACTCAAEKLPVIGTCNP